MISLERFLAWRFLVTGKRQSILTVSAVATAVTLIIFLNCLMEGLQRRMMDDIVGNMAQVTIKSPEPEARKGHTDDATISQRPPQQESYLKRPDHIIQELSPYKDIVLANTVASGQVFIIQGNRREGASLSGSNPILQDSISRISRDLTRGRWLNIGPQEAAIGYQLADKYDVGLGDRLLLLNSKGQSSTVIIQGIFNTGNKSVDEGRIFTDLNTAQSALGIGNQATEIQLKTADPWDAKELAQKIEEHFPYKVTNWMSDMTRITSAFRAQDMTRIMISIFALISSALGIASVLIVSVLQRKKQIGILKSMGATDRQILRLFGLQGLLIGILGSVLGAVLGTFFLMAIASIPSSTSSSGYLFTIYYSSKVYLIAMFSAIAVTLLGAAIPALQAASLKPVEALND